MTELRQVFDDLVRFETILWGAADGKLQDIARAVVITVGGASSAG